MAQHNDPKAFARAINGAGYATDPAYAIKLIGLMDRFNLYAYDL
jgi:flagellar protein FlgJ